MNNFFRFFISCGARTEFEKARLQATYEGDTDPPQEHNLQKILNVLNGKDEDATDQDAFLAITQQIRVGKLSWVIAIKSLILLDRAVNQLIMLKPILQVNLKRVEEYQAHTPEEQHLLIDLLVQYYYKYIKMKSFYYQKPNLSLLIERRQKKVHFMNLEIDAIIQDLQYCIELMEYAIELAYTDQRGHLRYKLNQYVFLLLLKDLLNIYSSQLIGINTLTNRIQQLSQENIDTLKKIIINFNLLYDKMVFFINSHPYIDGFADVDLSQFKKVDLQQILQDYEQLIKDQSIQYGNESKQITLTNQEDIIFDFRQTKRNKSIIVPNKPSKQKFDSRVEQLRKFPQRCFASFDEMIFTNFENNFCQDYRPIIDEDRMFYESGKQNALKFRNGIRRIACTVNSSECYKFIISLIFCQEKNSQALRTVEQIHQYFDIRGQKINILPELRPQDALTLPEQLFDEQILQQYQNTYCCDKTDQNMDTLVYLDSQLQGE